MNLSLRAQRSNPANTYWIATPRRLSGLAMTVLMFFSGCGGGGTSLPSAHEGAVHLTVQNAKAAVGTTGRTQIAKYQVVVSGTGFDPITQTFDGAAESGVIEGIPAGSDRTVAVTALNSQEEIIRAGDAAAIEVRGGEVADIGITLDIVPLFADLRDESVVPNTRLRLALQGAVGASLAVDAGGVEDSGTTAASVSPLIDAALNRPMVTADAVTGAALLTPARLAPGRYQMTVRDERTGRRSTVTIRVTDGTKLRGAPLVAAGRDDTQVGGLPESARSAWPVIVQKLGQ